MGNRLFTEVTDLTGLPKNLISDELVSILGEAGSNPHAVTMEDLRKAMAMYLTEVMGEHVEEASTEFSNESSKDETVPSDLSHE